jgi:Na+/melibiose symporter-like transporter
LGRNIGKHKAFAVCMATVSIISVSMVFLGEGDLTAFLILFILKGACFGGLQFLPLAMLADVIDVDTARSKGKRAGAFFAISGMIGKVSVAIGTSLPLYILAFVGFNPSGAEGVNSDFQLAYLAFNYAIMPAVFFAAALYLIWHYPLTPERHARLRRALERRAERLDGLR